MMNSDRFADRHIGLTGLDRDRALQALGVDSLEALMAEAMPSAIRSDEAPAGPPAATEAEALAELRLMASRNRVRHAYLGQGFHACHTPSVILRNVLENPAWYTPYTPYQPEISQGRLEALLAFQTLAMALTGLDLANASLLDEATACAEAMGLAFRARGRKDGRTVFFVDENVHPQNLAVVTTRARPLGITVESGPLADCDFGRVFGVLVQYPGTDGAVPDLAAIAPAARAAAALVVAACDPLALCLLRPPGELGADVAVGSLQRFGMPMGFGGPHAAFFATRAAWQRLIPGRIVGVSRDAEGRPAYRLSLQTREQHIRRDKATSNICTAQALPANVAAFYAVWHGPDGLRAIARRVAGQTWRLGRALREAGHRLAHERVFDTLRVACGPCDPAEVRSAAEARGILLRSYADGSLGIALDETVTEGDLAELCACFGTDTAHLPDDDAIGLPASACRERIPLDAPVFHEHRSESAMMRFLHRLAARDIGLTRSMIPLGSCTMKLNAAAEMLPITWPEWAGMHPFAPAADTEGYAELARQLADGLARLTGFAATSLQPNAGSQGEYTGLLAIRRYHESRGEGHRDICLIPASAHGTNPASAIMAGLRVVGVTCDADGNVDLDHLRTQAGKHADRLAALMITYPSTHGVFEAGVREISQEVHRHGGQVYLDGANLNALVGWAKPADLGADVCHINLHKTFCIPHGGGGPGMGPICVAGHLAPFLPGDPADPEGGAVSATALGSGCILPISWMYIRMMGGAGLREATACAILAANYLAHRLHPHFPVVYRGAKGRVAHECIIDLRPYRKSAGIEPDDVAKRLMDFGFHAPTMSWPVAGTLMVEPTESENLAELDRFADAMAAIREEIRAIENGTADRKDNPLRRAPHTAPAVVADAWDRPYAREQAAFPAPWVREDKYWPPVARVDSVYGDRNLVCACGAVADYETAAR